MDNNEWKKKIQNAWDTCQSEVKKTTNIGKKMFSASKTNSFLHESYEELGKLVCESLDSGDLKWENPKVEVLMDKIAQCQENLKEIEVEMNKLKFSSGPEDISKDQRKQ